MRREADCSLERVDTISRSCSGLSIEQGPEMRKGFWEVPTLGSPKYLGNHWLRGMRLRELMDVCLFIMYFLLSVVSIIKTHELVRPSGEW